MQLVWICEKSNKYFLNLEKSRACQNILHKICSETQEITDLTKINTTIFDFYANLFKEKLKTNSESLNNFLNDLSIPSLSETEKQICVEKLTEKDIYESISFDNNKSPGNDGLTKEFYQTFWQDVKDMQLVTGIQTIKIPTYITMPSNY